MTLSGRTRLLTLGASAVLAAVLIGAGVAMAQDSGTPTTTPPPTQSAEFDGDCGHAGVRGILGSILENSGLDRDVFKQGFEDGKTINQILTENGGDPATVQAAVLADVKAKLDERVADGKMTQQEADEAYANAEQKLPEFMDSTPEFGGGHRFGGKIISGLKGMLGSAAESLGMEASDLAERLRGGDTIATVANEKGVSVDAVIDAMVADANARIDQAVADGKINQARADEMKSNLKERITTFVNEGAQHDHNGFAPRGAGFAPRGHHNGSTGQAQDNAFAPQMARFGR